MPRKSLGPRLYVDEIRKQWVIRDGTKFIRTGCDVADEYCAIKQLDEYKSNLPAPEVRAKGAGYIYFMSAVHPGYPIKVGFTEKLGSHRKRYMQTGCPYPLVMLGTMTGTRGDEYRLHRTFDHLRMEGEWFRRDEALLAYIDSLCSQAKAA